MNIKFEVPWGDNWYIDGDNAWFIDVEEKALMHIDLKSKECDYLEEIPDMGASRFRLYPRCIKCDDKIFLMPHAGSCILIYQLNGRGFKKIDINNSDSVRLSITNFWRDKEKIIAISSGLQQVLEISIEEEKVVNYYPICCDSDRKIVTGIKLENMIYCASSETNEVYQFDLESKLSVCHKIPDIEGGIYAMCYDGVNFWLSGYRKEIYVWNKEENSVRIIINLPKDFGLYRIEDGKEDIVDYETTLYNMPAFFGIFSIGQYVWFIPFMTNKILYIDKVTYEIHIFDVKEEIESKDSLTKLYGSYALKYRVETIRDNRYIVIYSVKNKCYFEIDTIDKTYEIKEYYISDFNLEKRYAGKVLSDNSPSHQKYFKSCIAKKVKHSLEKTSNAGKEIYKMVKGDC